MSNNTVQNIFKAIVSLLCSASLRVSEVCNNTVQNIFNKFYSTYCDIYGLNREYEKVARAIMNCKTGALGSNMSICIDCGHTEIHHNSCRNRNCPNCQAIPRELWIDARKAEVIDAPYFHVVFTVPSELNPLIICNQEKLYSLFHKCVSQTLLELSMDEKFLGAKPGIIQVLHTWGQNLDYHPHIHAIITGGGLTALNMFKVSDSNFFIPVHILSKKFRGKFLYYLEEEYQNGNLIFSWSTQHLRNPYDWNFFINSLYTKGWIPFIKQTFNGAGNAIEYLGRYTHRIAISNNRIINVTDDDVTFSAKDYRTNQNIEITLGGVEFIRRFLMHVLPKGFVKIRSYGFLCNCAKNKNIAIIRTQTKNLGNRAKLAELKIDALLLLLYKIDIHKCPRCQSSNFYPVPYYMIS